MNEQVRRALAVGAVAVVVLAAALAAAPSYAAASAARSCPRSTLPQAIAKADVVFRGAVVRVRPAHGTGSGRMRTYLVSADRVYKSSLVTDRVVVTARVGTRCALPTLKQGARYIFFVNEQGARLMAATSTARATTALTRQVVQRLGDGAQPSPTPPAAATFTKVADATPPSLSRLLAPGAAMLIVSLLGLAVVGRLGRRSA